jgi:ADP-ribosylglycohydrolase
MSLDQIRGVLAGVMLGDALGAPYEFRGHGIKEYSRELQHIVKLPRRYQPALYFPVASITDDSEMTLMTVQNLVKNHGKFSPEDAILQYMEWANSGMKMMGINTRALFHGIKTVRGYKNRIAKMNVEGTQSNGALMRCSVLAISGNTKAEFLEDCKLTNPGKVALDTNQVYFDVINNLLRKKEPLDDVKAETKEVDEILDQAIKGEPRNIKMSKGWCLNALWISLVSILHMGEDESYGDVIERVIRDYPGSDTDTNAAITGALLGAKFGFEKLMETQRENFQKILEAETERPEKYRPAQFYKITEDLEKLIWIE